MTETAEGRTTRVSEIVASGSDFAIHLYDLGWDVDDPSSYFAEFSGLHIASCSSAMPTGEERARLRAFWPLVSGQSIDLNDVDESTYVVGDRERHTVSQVNGEHPAQLVTAYVGEVRTDMTVSLALRTPVSVTLQDGTDEHAIEIFNPRMVRQASEVDRSVLGNCASLLDGALVR
ncbi:MAG: hypothetical protein AAF950_04200 [Pseudomonadota bacterium]